MQRWLVLVATVLLIGWSGAAVAVAQLPMRVLGHSGNRIILVGGDSLASLDSLPPGEILPEFKRCDAPTPPLGAARGSGTVTYSLLTDGTVDTSTIEAVETRGMSFPGVESAATRVLGQCHFKPARLDGHAVPIRMAQIMKFETALPQIQSIVATARVVHVGRATTTLAALGFGTDTTLIIYDGDSRDLDEAPAMHSCRAPLLPFALRSAAVTMQYVVDVDGTVDSAAMRINVDRSSASELETKSYFRAFAARCRYAPARVLGRPVPMVVEQKAMVR
ncbi:MAG: hypothetical protein ACREL2_07685 [Gemmatimonadales bacterium]